MHGAIFFLLENLALQSGLGQMPAWGIAITWQQLFRLQKRRTITLECGFLRKFWTISSTLKLFHSIFHSILKFYEELVVQNLCRELHSSVMVRCFRKLKSCCYVIAIPSGCHPYPNPNCNARFWSKKKIASCISFPVPAYCITHSLPNCESNLGAEGW